MTGYEKLEERDLLCLEKSENVCKAVKQSVNKDHSSIGRKEIVLSYRMCGKAVKEEIIRLVLKNPKHQLNVFQAGLRILDPGVD